MRRKESAVRARAASSYSRYDAWAWSVAAVVKAAERLYTSQASPSPSLTPDA